MARVSNPRPSPSTPANQRPNPLHGGTNGSGPRLPRTDGAVTKPGMPRPDTNGRCGKGLLLAHSGHIGNQAQPRQSPALASTAPIRRHRLLCMDSFLNSKKPCRGRQGFQ
jgi:hypothetical protein